MKKTDLNTSKILLIILGVLVAIIIGFNSRAVGSKSTNLKWTNLLEEKAQNISKSTLKQSSQLAVKVFESLRTNN